MVRGLRRTAGAVALAASAAAFVGCGGSDGDDAATAGTTGGGSGTEAITVLVAPVYNEPVYLAKERGLFEEEGLDVTVKVGSTADAQIPQLLRNDAQIGVSSGISVTNAVTKNLGIKLVAGIRNLDPAQSNTGVRTLAGSGIETMKDLTGKTVAIDGLRNTTELFVRHGIDEEGGDSSQTEFVTMPTASMTAALEKGTVDAAYLLSPFYEAAPEATFAKIDNPAIEEGSPLVGLPNIAFAAADSYIADKPEVLESFRTAMERAYAFGMKHPDALREQLAKHSKLDAEALKKTDFDYEATIHRGALDAMTEDMVRYGFVEEAPSAEELVWSGAPTGDDAR